MCSCALRIEGGSSCVLCVSKVCALRIEGVSSCVLCVSMVCALRIEGGSSCVLCASKVAPPVSHTPAPTQFGSPRPLNGYYAKL